MFSGTCVAPRRLRMDRRFRRADQRSHAQQFDSYTEGVIDKAEFGRRIAGLKQRLSQLDERHRVALDAIEVERDLSLVVSRLAYLIHGESFPRLASIA
jgi:hypothetical protein